jgi:hypothetical protein
MRLEKDDFGIWDNDDEELSIIKKGYTSKEIVDYILSLQDEIIRLKKENEMSTIVIRDMIQKMPKDTLYFPPMEDKQ